MKNVFSRISSSPVVRCCHWSYTWRSKQRMCGTAGSSGTLWARRSHQLCEGTCWAKQEAATWACSASRDLWPPDCSCWMQSTLLLTPHGDAGCLSHYMLLTYAQISAVTEYSGADDFWKKFKRLVFLYKALINQVVDIRFYRSPPVLPCFEGKPSEAKLHPNLSLSRLTFLFPSAAQPVILQLPISHDFQKVMCHSVPQKSITPKASFPGLCMQASTCFTDSDLLLFQAR